MQQQPEGYRGELTDGNTYEARQTGRRLKIFIMRWWPGKFLIPRFLFLNFLLNPFINIIRTNT